MQMIKVCPSESGKSCTGGGRWGPKEQRLDPWNGRTSAAHHLALKSGALTEFVLCNINSVGHPQTFLKKTSLGDAGLHNIHSVKGFYSCILPNAIQMFIYPLV